LSTNAAPRDKIKTASCVRIESVSGSPYEIDHVFVCTSPGAPEADAVFALGLREGTPNTHPGQGTANRRVFFDNAMLEFVWVADETEAKSPAVRRLGLWERWHLRNAGACPFGICFRPATDPTLPAPFESWQYHPAYAPITIDVAVSSDRAEEPLLFYIPHVRGGRAGEPRDHPAGMRTLTSVELEGPTMQLLFDEGAGGRRHDFRPGLPLVMTW